MKNKSAIIYTIIFFTSLVLSGVYDSSGYAKSPYKTNELKLLEQAESYFTAQNKKVPDEILTKIKLETQYSEKLANEKIKRDEEIKKLHDIRKKASKDAKGNPIIPEPIFSNQKPKPYEEAGKVGKKDYAESFFPRVFTYNHELVSAITSSYHVLVSGINKNDPTHSFIIDINNNASKDQQGRKQYNFTGKGQIKFTKLLNDRIAEFKFNNDQDGYFDILNGSITFSPYVK